MFILEKIEILMSGEQFYSWTEDSSIKTTNSREKNRKFRAIFHLLKNGSTLRLIIQEDFEGKLIKTRRILFSPEL